MDALGMLLDGPRAERAFLLRAVFAGTWSIRVEDEAALSLVVMAQGTAVLTSAGGVHELGPGDVVLLRGPAPYTFADAAETPDDIRILPGQVCVDPAGHLLGDSLDLGVRTWGNTREPDATTMLIGTYERATSVGSMLLARLPEAVVLHALDSPLVDLLAAELERDADGQHAVLDRLLDLLLVTCLREALPTAATRPADPAVGLAVRALHERPEHPWTVQELADLVGLSRAALARRFTQEVGEPPLTHLTRWRLTVAADLVAGTDLTLAAVAARVGYANAFALSAAFKRVHGCSPAAYRAREGADLVGPGSAG